MEQSNESDAESIFEFQRASGGCIGPSELVFDEPGHVQPGTPKRR